jgi:hypothetical protein
MVIPDFIPKLRKFFIMIIRSGQIAAHGPNMDSLEETLDIFIISLECGSMSLFGLAAPDHYHYHRKLNKRIFCYRGYLFNCRFFALLYLKIKLDIRVRIFERIKRISSAQ